MNFTTTLVGIWDSDLKQNLVHQKTLSHKETPSEADFSLSSSVGHVTPQADS